MHQIIILTCHSTSTGYESVLNNHVYMAACLALLLGMCHPAEISSSLNPTHLTRTLSSPAAAYMIVLMELVTLVQERQSPCSLILTATSSVIFTFDFSSSSKMAFLGLGGGGGRGLSSGRAGSCFTIPGRETRSPCYLVTWKT